MIYNAKNGNIKIENTEMEYVSFGSGDKYLVIIPGLGDALKTVKGTAVPFAWMYRKFSDEYSVYIFSRKNNLEMGYSTSDMADEVSYAMNQLEIDNADIIGVSQGGMIAQYLAINYPDKVDKLVLAITAVSYTHLDVYKRQILYFIFIIPTINDEEKEEKIISSEVVELFLFKIESIDF